MRINTNNLVSMSEANQNFSKIARIVDKNGAAIILKNNKPRYVILGYSQFENEEFAKDSTVIEIGEAIINRNIVAFKELSK